ncbi:MAG: ribonuclease P protein component [Parvularculaceae bacterium]|nr:ribonuclease P protein component [Parvularculaceae bacterium]
MRRRADFLALRQAQGCSTKSFLAVKRPRNDDDSTIRFGFTVTKKIGKAVRRNRIRRRLREAARAVGPGHGEPGCDYVLIARAAAADRGWSALLDDLRRALLSLARNPK